MAENVYLLPNMRCLLNVVQKVEFVNNETLRCHSRWSFVDRSRYKGVIKK